MSADNLVWGNLYIAEIVNYLSIATSYQSNPLVVVCDEEFLCSAQIAFPALTSIELSEWLESNSQPDLAVDLVLCNATSPIQRIRDRDPSAYVVAVVEQLKDTDFKPILHAGADDIIMHDDVNNGRLSLMLRQQIKQQSIVATHAAFDEITHSFYAASNLRELIDDVSKYLLGAFNSKHVTVCQVDSEGRFVLLAEWRRTEEKMHRVNFANVKLMANSISQWCVENRQIGLVRRGVEDDRDSASVQKIRRLLSIGCAVTLPLIQEDSVWGVLILEKDIAERNFTDVELSLLELLISQMSNSILRQNLLDEIHFQAFHDSLTKLPNRLKFENTLKQYLSTEHSVEEKFALLFLDLDGFKGVNDHQGHSVGDELLKQVAKRLSGCLQERDLLARMGGDEFAVLLRGVKSTENALSISMRLSEAIGKKFTVDKYSLKIGVSIGLSFYPDNGETVDELLRNADFAMYEAKADGKGSVRSFNQDMAEQYRERLALESSLLNAMENEQFELYYQPKVDLVQGKVVGLEALLRWNHPTLGCVSPLDFVSIAEDAGYITTIGNWVLNKAISQNAMWHTNGLPELRIAVNISGSQFVLEDFVAGVLAMLEHNNLDPTQLELEVQESVVMNNLTKVIDTLNTLRDQGISISIDGFGLGYSSLSYLGSLPLDCMKIDKTFVDMLNSGHEEYSLVNTILTMARTFRLKAVAEGIESEEQLQKLLALGCECVQGFYFSKPLPAAEVPAAIVSIEEQFQTLIPQLRKVG